MTTATLRVPATTNGRRPVAAHVTNDHRHVRFIAETIGSAGKTRSQRKKDFKRRGAAWLRGFVAMLYTLRDVDRAPAAELRGVVRSMLSVADRVIDEGATPVRPEDLRALIREEQERENAGNSALVDALEHLSEGNLRALRARTMEEIESEQRLVAAIDAILLDREG